MYFHKHFRIFIIVSLKQSFLSNLYWESSDPYFIFTSLFHIYILISYLHPYFIFTSLFHIYILISYLHPYFIFIRCCHNTALLKTMYLYWLFLRKCNFNQAQCKLPEDGPIGPKHVGVNMRYFNVNFNISYVQ
jgi:hypothetical protein